MRRIELTEHQSSVHALNELEAGFIAAECSGALRIELAKAGEYRLRTRQFVGVVHGRELELRIRPKCSTEALFYLLSHAYDLTRIRNELARYDQQDDLFEFFVALFARQTEQLVRSGIRRSYREERDDLRVIRGRLDMSRLALTLARPEPMLPCEFEEFTEDVFDNRVLRYTLDRLRRAPLTSSLLRARLRRLRHRLAGVSSVPIRAVEIERREYDRLSEPYRPVHGLCRLILDACGLHERSGPQLAPGFLVDMNAVFEKFVLVSLQAAARAPLTARGQVTTSFDVDRHASIRPDIVLRWDGRDAVVMDTKYKRTDDSRVANADVYQALAYARALRVRVAYLVYPAWEESPRRLRLRDGANEIVIDTVELAGGAEAISASVSGLLHRVGRDALIEGRQV